MSAPLNMRVSPHEVGGSDFRHLVARRHQAIDHAAIKGHLADGEDIGVRSAETVIHNDAAALPDRQSAGTGQVVARLDSGRDDDHLDVDLAAIGEGHALDLAVAEYLLGILVEMDLHAQLVDLADQQASSRPRRFAGA